MISRYCVFILYWNPTLIQSLSGRVSLFDDDIRCGLLSVEYWGLVMSTLHVDLIVGTLPLGIPL